MKISWWGSGLLLGLLWLAPASAAPYVPKDEAVLERLPLRRADPRRPSFGSRAGATLLRAGDGARRPAHIGARSWRAAIQGRSKEVGALLAQWGESDNLLLRLALAAKRLGLVDAQKHERAPPLPRTGNRTRAARRDGAARGRACGTRCEGGRTGAALARGERLRKHGWSSACSTWSSAYPSPPLI